MQPCIELETRWRMRRPVPCARGRTAQRYAFCMQDAAAQIRSGLPTRTAAAALAGDRHFR